jgi:hypothetical protein
MELGKKLNSIKSKFLDKIDEISDAAKREVHETHEASIILLKMSKGEDVTKEEIEFLKNQSVDVVKVLGLIGLQAIPFSSAGIVAIEAIGKKHGFSLFPKQNEEKEDDKEKK